MKNALCWLFILSVIAGCSNYNITYNRTPGTDFSKYRTYAWIPPDSTPGKFVNRKHLNDRIIYYSGVELANKGLSVNTGEPDAVFNFYTYSIDKVEYQYSPPPASVSFGYGGPGYYMGYSAPIGSATVMQYNYKEGTLVMEMIDTKSQTVVWKSVASQAIDQTTDLDAVLKGAIHSMMSTLPVKVK